MSSSFSAPGNHVGERAGARFENREPAKLWSSLHLLHAIFRRPTGPVKIESVGEMEGLLEECKVPLDHVYRQIRGDSMTSAAVSSQHEVLRAIKARALMGSKPGARNDHMKIALAIEGGGMRGSVSAGMAAALEQLGLSDAFDVVYGSSAGALVGTYFVSGGGLAETHRFFLEVLCESGTTFLDTTRVLDFISGAPFRGSAPVMSLDTISDIMCSDPGGAALDWQVPLFTKTCV
jgi:hypothetical protein